MSRSYYLRPMAVGVVIVALAAASGAAYAAAQAPHSPKVIVTGPDHERLTFALSPGRSVVFALPDANDPITVDIAAPSTNGGLQNPSEVFSALINADADHAGMSWIGTSSDGSQRAGNTHHGTDITNLVCGKTCVVAWLRVKSVAVRTVVLTSNAKTSAIRELYVVNIWY
jgi:hypothetical protein